MARLPPVASTSAVRVDILGPLRLERDGEPVELSGGRLRALLTRLALDAGRPVTTSALADAVWDNDLPSDEQHALQSLVSRLRRSVGDVLEATPGGYRLAVAPDAVDAARFERLVAEGRPREALALWRGASGIAALEEARLRALLALDDATLPELEAAVAEHPLNEKLAARHIAALAAAGRQADALSAYEHVRIRLDEELGALPSPELAEAHLAVLKVPVRRTSNLRAPVTSFVGREADLRADRRAARDRAAGHARRPGRRRQDAAGRRGAAHAGLTASTAACGWSSWRRSRPRSRSFPPRWPRSACAKAPCSTARAPRCAMGWSA